MFGFLKGLKDRKPTVWRQGDVFLIATPDLPDKNRVDHRPVLAEGEITGHAHRLEDPASGQVFSVGGSLFLEVLTDSAAIVHEEHGPVVLPRGGYAIRIQREYSPKEIRRVVD